MSYEISNDASSLILQRSLKAAAKEAEASMVKLSHGKKLSAIEDAANLIISEGMESQRRGSMQAAENAQTGMNMLATAESGLESVSDNLQRIRELEVQKRNGTLGEDGKAAIDSEINALTEEINRVAKSTSFNDVGLLDGSSSDITLQTGPDGEAETNSLEVGQALGSVKSEDLGLDSSAPDFLEKIDGALSKINSQRAEIGAIYNRLEGTVTSLYVKNENLAAAQSRISDVDVAEEASKLTQNRILENASASLMAQANQTPSAAISLL